MAACLKCSHSLTEFWADRVTAAYVNSHLLLCYVSRYMTYK